MSAFNVQSLRPELWILTLVNTTLIYISPPEVVLAVLLTAFRFELTDRPIAWNSSAVSYPTMGEESTKVEMLLKVQAL